MQTTNGDIAGDGYVLACGVGSAAIARTVGLRVPVYPAKGYSATFPIRDDGECPSVGGVDENTLVAWSKLGDVLRMSSTAEFAGYDRSWRKEDFDGVLETARRLFPTAAHYDQGRVPRLPAADDARRAAADRADEAAQPLAQHRARPHGLDDGSRLGQARRGRDRKARARHRHGGHAGALS